MPYDIKRNYGGCSGYAVVGPSGSHGCHSTRAAAINQQRALYAAEANNKKSVTKMNDLYSMLNSEEKAYHDALIQIVEEFGPFDQGSSGVWVGYEPSNENEDSVIGVKCGNCSFHYDAENGLGCKLLSFLVEEDAKCRLAAIPDSLVNTEMSEVAMTSGESQEFLDEMVDSMGKADSVRVGQMVSWNSSGGRARGKVLRIVRNGKYNVPNSSFTVTGTPDNPAVVIRVYRDDKPTDTIVGHKMKTLNKYTNILNFSKAEETFSPSAGMKSAARRALKWKEEGKATGAGTPVGWGRASDIVAGRPMSLSVVRRMYSFFSRHEVDKKGKDFNNTANPSNGRIMWDAWGGDAGFSWSRSIVNRYAKKDVWVNSPFSFQKDLTNE